MGMKQKKLREPSKELLFTETSSDKIQLKTEGSRLNLIQIKL